jgi:hypothetical protein
MQTRHPACVLLCLLLSACGGDESGPGAEQGRFPANVVEPATRPVLDRAAIEQFVPDQGPFRFPAPWSSRGTRLTNASDCGGSDCVQGYTYAYWKNLNNHRGDSEMLAFVGLEATRGGTGPTLFAIDKRSLKVRKLGPLFDAGSSLRLRSGEGFYFSATLPTALYVHEGARLSRYDVLSHTFDTVYDATSVAGSGALIRQGSSSNDDMVHAAVLQRDGASLGCWVFDERRGEGQLFPPGNGFDECQIDKSGRWLVIKENVDGANAEDNRIVDLERGTESIILDENGALGHSDLGYGYGVGEDNWAAEPGAVRLWKFEDMSQKLVFNTFQWGVDAGHISHENAYDGPPESQYACSGQAGSIQGPRANELVCYPLDGSKRVLPVAPVMTSTSASGGGDSYAQMPKANVDVTGRYIFWTSNLHSDRLDAFVAEIPVD